MKCFDVVQKALDETYEEVPDKGGKRDASIKQALARMSEQYNNRLMTEGGPDFTEAATRFGYVYRYVPAHAHWLYELITEVPAAQEILNSGKARIICLGGGPGSDVVGVLKYLDECSVECSLFCEIVDYCEEWQATWADVAYSLGWGEAFHTHYVIHDADDASTWNYPCKIAKADIITMSFFASEIHHLPNSEEYLHHMLSSAKKGAVLLMNDNRTSDVYNRLDKLAAKCGFEVLHSGEGDRKIYDWGEKMSVLKNYTDRFDSDAKLTGKLCWRAYRKK